MVYILIGVAGVGKSTVGKKLAKMLDLTFIDADKYHSRNNLYKMTRSIPLNDEDRRPWLDTLNKKISEWNNDGGAILACSALKESYRIILSRNNDVVFVALEGSKDLIRERLMCRKHHVFSFDLLQSQFECYESPLGGIIVSVNQSVEQICLNIIERAKLTVIKYA